ncbi:MAG: ABC transporter ATP-binding protein [Planctomycetota bacterium]|nr:ABC transporter ATP-binding protein [Planctomycetota bacterium]
MAAVREEVTVRSGDDGPGIPVRELMRRLLALAWRHRRVAWPAVLATVVFQVFTLAGLAGQGLAIDVIREKLDPGAPAAAWPLGLRPPSEWGLAATVGVVAAAVLVLSAAAGVARFFIRVCDERFVQACVVDLRQRLYEKLQRLPFGFFDTIDTGQVINRVTGDSQQVRAFIQGIMIRAGIAAITLAIFLGYMISTHPLLTLACAVVYPLQVAVMTRYSRVTKPRYLEQSKQADVMVKALQESIAGVRVVRVFGRERERQGLFVRLCERLRDQAMDIAGTQSRHMPFVGASNIVAQATLLGLGGLLVIKGPAEGGIALGTFWVFRGLLERLASQADAIVSIIGETPEALAGAERVFKLLDLPVIADGTEELETGAGGPGVPGVPGVRGVRGAEIEFRDVTFGYDPAKPVLHGVSFRVRAGETVAIVGPTGSGKTTLLSLIARFYDPQAGRVLIDGRDVRTIRVADLRRAIGMVFQEPFLFSNTVAANVAFGRPEADEEEIRRATDIAAASGFIDELPEGLRTIIGERGVSLSGGQRQRLTIARALLVDPRVLIFDDATGSIDALTESEIQAAMEEVMRGRTAFVVAHRLSTLRRADRILVLEKGRIIDSGSHEELMSRAGHYRAAALIQLALDEAEEKPGQARGRLGQREAS